MTGPEHDRGRQGAPADADQSRWFCGRLPQQPSRHRLFCFAYAGGTATIYRRWIDALAPAVDVFPIELPGRWSRLREPPYTSMERLQADLFPAIAPHVGDRFSLFGYSLGGLIAYLLAHDLRRALGVEPAHLMVAARSAPSRIPRGPRLGELPEAEFIARLAERYAPIPEPILRDPEMRELVLRNTRADIRVFESYRYTPEPPLTCPITAFGGDRDRHIGAEGLQAWSELTTGAFQLKMFPGDHFFINSHGVDLMQEVRAQLAGAGGGSF